MKAGLPELEKRLLMRWDTGNLYRQLRDRARGREPFVLHDGPPYANRHIHIGTAMNKILKDMVTRAQQMLGKDSNYVPGWDCHGLPIEWQVEQQYLETGHKKADIPIGVFRNKCREFAAHWIDVQKAEFRRLGVEGDWQCPYTTMSFEAEAHIAAEILKFLMNGSLHSGAKPVLWSVAEQTALAEAEVEYHDHQSTTIHVRFSIQKTPSIQELLGASLIIWTTTPWTIPGNRAIAIKANATYVLIKITGVTDESKAKIGENIVVAEPLLQATSNDTGISSYEIVKTFQGQTLVGTECAHPWRGLGYDFAVPVLAADFVAMDQGTGLVHINPGAGSDDFELGSEHGLEVPDIVDETGHYRSELPFFSGENIFSVDLLVSEKLDIVDALLSLGTSVHSYPHSCRSKKPLIFRTTPQWFISMTRTGLREHALKAIEDVRWLPRPSQNRIRSMVEKRSEWVLSRQRSWGVPIPLFINHHTREPLRDETVNERICSIFAAEGSDSWFDGNAQHFLGERYDPNDYEMVQDIAEVWFDSGCTHGFVVDTREDLQWPASLYLEGTDQHRGWFQSSLLESCGTRGCAPFETVLTHGFVMDGEGRKMSKSLGNVVSPSEVTERYGAEILRIWVASSDYTEDLRIGPDIIQHQIDTYRRLRNTFRFLLGNLHNFTESERVPYKELPELERWILHKLHHLDKLVRKSNDDFDFHNQFTALYTFCTVDLSAFYFDICKDSLYCDPSYNPRRQAVRSTIDCLFSCLTKWLAPILCFTAEEAWIARWGETTDSVHLEMFPDLPSEWRDDELAERWELIRTVRRVVTGALEVERKEKRLGSSLQAHPVIYTEPKYLKALQGADLAEICITSDASIAPIDKIPIASGYSLDEVPGVTVVCNVANGNKCERCWKVLPEVSDIDNAENLCARCSNALTKTLQTMDRA